MKTQIVSFLVFLKCLNLLKICFVNIHANWSHAVKSPRFRTTPISLPTIAFRSASIIRPSEWHSALAQCDQLENCENNIISCCSYCCGTKRSCVLCWSVLIGWYCVHWCSHARTAMMLKNDLDVVDRTLDQTHSINCHLAHSHRSYDAPQTHRRTTWTACANYLCATNRVLLMSPHNLQHPTAVVSSKAGTPRFS